MFGFGKKAKTKNKENSSKMSQTTVVSNNNTIETRRLTYSFSTTESSSSKTVVTGNQSNQWISTNSNPNISLSIPFNIDAKPFTTTPFQPNYKSPFQRNHLSYGSERLSTTSSTHPPPINSRPILPSTRTTLNNNDRVSVVPTYSTNGTKRGNVIIINNIKFIKDKLERTGAEIDEIDIAKLFRNMGFEVKVHRNLKSSEMKTKIKNFSSDKTLSKVDISIVIMMSHGSNKNDNNQTIPGSFTQILGTDDKNVSIEEVLAEFTTDKCPGMKGKPKIFIFQCCRGEQGETIHVDAAPIRNVIKQHSDMLIAFSTLPGFYSARDPKKGSWYIQSICDVFERHAKTEDVESLLKIVDEQLSNKHPTYVQTSNYESRGFKKCFLNPK